MFNGFFSIPIPCAEFKITAKKNMVLFRYPYLTQFLNSRELSYTIQNFNLVD